MTTNLIPFEFESQAVRVIDRDAEPWFVLADVCRVLEVANSRDASARLDDDEKADVGITDTSSNGVAQRRDMTIINESGLYSLILTSRKPAAKRFKKWVTADVLPTIRKTGTYGAPTAIPDFTNPAAAARAWADQFESRLFAERTKAEIGTRREATAMNTASQAVKRANRLEVELDRARSYATVKRMGLLHHGQDFSWRVLKRMSEQMGILPIDVFDANYGTVKAYHADVWQAAYALDIPQREEDASEDSGEGSAMRPGPVLAVNNAAGTH